MPDSVAPETTQPRLKRKRRWPLIVALVVGLIFLVWIGLLVRDGLALRADVLALQDYAAALPQPVQPADIDMAWLQQRVTSLDDNLNALRSHAGPLLLLTPALGWLPEIGGDVQAAPALLDMAWNSPISATRHDGAGAALAAGNNERPPLAAGRGAAAASAAADDDRRGTRISIGCRRRANASTPRACRRGCAACSTATTKFIRWRRPVFEFVDVAPQLLGADRPRTYLLLFQNEDELRATGGFLSAVGRVTIDAGQIISLTVEDSYAVDDFTTPYPDAPAPLRDYMGIDLWVFRDSNWSPDFPVAARQAISLYTQTRGGTIDGVIALNQQVVEALVDGLGPLTIDGQTIANAQAMRDYMRAAWAPSDQSSRHRVDGAAQELHQPRHAGAARSSVERRGDVNWQTLGQALNRVLHSRDLLITLTDPQLNEPLRLAQLDGSLRSAASDFVMVVDTSMGFNKVSTVMQQALQYTVTLATDRAPQAELTIVYTNTNPPAPGCEHRPPDYDLDITYEQLVQQCYWLYRRVLAPAGAELIDASRHPTGPGELVSGAISDGATRVTEEDGKTVFGTFLIVPRGQRVDSRLSYTLPASIVQTQGDQLRYHLVWQKQPGAAAWPVRVTVVFPAGAALLEAQPQPVTTTANSATFQFDLDTDREVHVTFKLK